MVSDFTSSSISLSKIAQGGFHPREEGFGAALTVRKTANALANAMMRKAVTKAFRAEENERMARTLSALHIICERLTLMRGRKSLLWISAGSCSADQPFETRSTD